ncbi:MAG: hypothetical protein DWQ31_14605 [Planctomycetota bacterium]|nr:MAG: hypothetical protein DWQ31_14605 [Planctomycetota bacterium]
MIEASEEINMSETDHNPFEAPEVDAGPSTGTDAGRLTGPPTILIALSWLGALLLLGGKLWGYATIGASDLLASFFALGLAIALARRMKRRAALWATWSFALPQLALVLSQFRPPGSASRHPAVRIVLRGAVALLVAVACYFTWYLDSVQTWLQTAMGETQAFLLTTWGYYTRFDDPTLVHENVRFVMLAPFASTLACMLFGLNVATFLYRTSHGLLLQMWVVGLVVGAVGDTVSQMMLVIAAHRTVAGESALLCELLGSAPFILLFQMLIIFGIAGRIAWHFTCDEYPRDVLPT